MFLCPDGHINTEITGDFFGCDECGDCDGGGIPDGLCDCDGNSLDDCGQCGGTTTLIECDGTAGTYNLQCDCNPLYCDICG